MFSHFYSVNLTINVLVSGFVGNRWWKKIFEQILGDKITFLWALSLSIFVSSKIYFYFGLKDNSTSTQFLLAGNCEIYWLHTVNVNKLMIQKRLGQKILRLLNQYCVNWQVRATILIHQTGIICGSHLILGSNETSYYYFYPMFYLQVWFNI